MNSEGITKIVVVILAVVSIGMFVAYCVGSSEDPVGVSEQQTSEIANYGLTQEPDEVVSGTETASGTYFISDDDNTVEMDSIPNEAGDYVPSASDAQ